MTDKSHLLRFGYAPGEYGHGKCDDCEQSFIGDKYARRCEACAETLYSQVSSVEAVADKHRAMAAVSEEAVFAAAKAITGPLRDPTEWELMQFKLALTAALPHLPGVGVKKLGWRSVVENGRDIQSFSPLGNYVISIDDAPAGDTHYLWVAGQSDSSDYHSSYQNMFEAKAAAQADYEARILSAIEVAAPDMGNPITLTYTNYRGETSERTITPIRPWYGSTEWHPAPQWLLKAYDHDKGAERDFAFKDIGNSEPSAARELALEEACKLVERRINMVPSDTKAFRAYQDACRHILGDLRALSSPGHADAGKLVEGDDVERNEFNRGYVLACANIVNLHSPDVNVAEGFAQLNITRDDLKRLDLCDYDQNAIHALEDFWGLEKLYVPSAPSQEVAG